MFGLGMGEIILIAVVALLAVGPDRLPQAARSIGKGIRDVRKQTDELQHAIEDDSQIGDAVRELRSAWTGTAGALPRNRHELGRAVDRMTRDDGGRKDAPARTGDPAEIPDTTDAAPADGERSAGAEGGPGEAGGAADDGMPQIRAPEGIVARGAPQAAGDRDTAAPSADSSAEDPAAPRDPAHG